MPFFSIITSTYNAAATLPRLLDSLAAQTCRDFNWIVQDGASTDATMEIVDGYRSVLPEVLAESRKDSGIYDAWNRALDRAGDDLGQWVLFLGADDWLAADDVLEKAKAFLRQQSDSIIYCCGDLYLFYGKERPVDLVKSNMKNSVMNFKECMNTPYPALFHNNKLFLYNRYSPEYKIAGDYEFLVRTISCNKYCEDIGFPIAIMSRYGISCTSQDDLNKERCRIRKKFFRIYFYYYKVKNVLFYAKMWIKHVFYMSKYGKNMWDAASLMKKSRKKKI